MQTLLRRRQGAWDGFFSFCIISGSGDPLLSRWDASPSCASRQCLLWLRGTAGPVPALRLLWVLHGFANCCLWLVTSVSTCHFDHALLLSNSSWGFLQHWELNLRTFLLGLKPFTGTVLAPCYSKCGPWVGNLAVSASPESPVEPATLPQVNCIKVSTFNKIQVSHVCVRMEKCFLRNPPCYHHHSWPSSRS